jgi:hypothetical protein
MQHYTPAPSFSRYVQSLHGMNEEIKLIVFLKMMKEIAQNLLPLQMRFRLCPVGSCNGRRWRARTPLLRYARPVGSALAGVRAGVSRSEVGKTMV